MGGQYSVGKHRQPGDGVGKRGLCAKVSQRVGVGVELGEQGAVSRIVLGRQLGFLKACSGLYQGGTEGDLGWGALVRPAVRAAVESVTRSTSPCLSASKRMRAMLRR